MEITMKRNMILATALASVLGLATLSTGALAAGNFHNNEPVYNPHPNYKTEGGRGPVYSVPHNRHRYDRGHYWSHVYHYTPDFRFVLPRLARAVRYGDFRGYRMIPERRIAHGLERRGFLVRGVDYRPGRNAYVVMARDPYGARVRLVIDPYTSELLRFRRIG